MISFIQYVASELVRFMETEKCDDWKLGEGKLKRYQ